MKQKGFTLVEIAIVLAIIGILMSGILGSISAQRDGIQKKEDAATLNRIVNALQGFVSVNGYMPCPDSNGDGYENRNANGYCAAVNGRLPYLEIGGEGNRDTTGQPFYYAVNTSANTINVRNLCEQASYFGRIGLFDPVAQGGLQKCLDDNKYYCPGDCIDAGANQNCATLGNCQSAAPVSTINSAPYFRFLTPPIGVGTAFAGSLQVCNDTVATCSAATPNAGLSAQYVTAVVVGYGKNAIQTWASCNNASATEQENCDGDRYFHQAQTTETFDDQVVWVTALQVKQAVVAAGRDLSIQ